LLKIYLSLLEPGRKL